ncbi:MAG: NUDIX domain-containing protein [Candidatus Gracilibacteria bacterium]|nr:NUDIX domain-containing protein [Candidatus Gracilibacteria bacterium]
MKIRKVSLIGFYNEKNQILLQERGDYSKNGEEWAFFGGGIEKGETPEEAFIREAKEELDLDMTKFAYDYLGESIYEFPEKIVYWNLFLIKTDLKETDFTVLEGKAAKYFSFEEAKKLKFPSDPSDMIDKIKNYILSK